MFFFSSFDKKHPTNTELVFINKLFHQNVSANEHDAMDGIAFGLDNGLVPLPNQAAILLDTYLSLKGNH